MQERDQMEKCFQKKKFQLGRTKCLPKQQLLYQHILICAYSRNANKPHSVQPQLSEVCSGKYFLAWFIQRLMFLLELLHHCLVQSTRNQGRSVDNCIYFYNPKVFSYWCFKKMILVHQASEKISKTGNKSLHNSLLYEKE